MNKRKKLNKLVKATTMVAFLFGIVALTSSGLCSLNSYSVTSEDSPCEVVCSSSISKTHATRLYKNANKQIDNITCDDLSIDTTNKLITLNYKLLDIYSASVYGDYVEYKVDVNLSVRYNYETQTLNEGAYFDLYFYNDFSGLEYEKRLSYQADDYTRSTIIYYTFEVSEGYIVDNPLTSVSPVTILGNFFTDADQNVVSLPIPDVEFYGTIEYEKVLTDVDILKNVGIDNAIATGIFKFANVTVGLYNNNTNSFDSNYSTNEGIEKIEGGFILNDFIYRFEDDFTEGIINESTYSPGWIASFGNHGVSLESIEYLFPLDNQNGGYYPVLTFGMEYQFNFSNGSITYRGADDGPLNQLKVTEYMRTLGNLMSIKALGNNYDYIPYGITQNLSYSFGYDSGYENGRSDGYDSGYDLGYTNGLNSTDNQKYQEGYNKGYEDATNRYSDGSLSLNGVLNAIVTAPSKIIKEGLDFEILGFNVGSLVMSLIVIGLLVWAIGFFKKG